MQINTRIIRDLLFFFAFSLSLSHANRYSKLFLTILAAATITTATTNFIVEMQNNQNRKSGMHTLMFTRTSISLALSFFLALSLFRTHSLTNTHEHLENNTL